MVTIRKSKKSKAKRLNIMFNNIRPLKRDDFFSDPSDKVSESNYLRKLDKLESSNGGGDHDIKDSLSVQRRKEAMNMKSARTDF